MSLKLNQVIAIEKGIKTRTHDVLTEVNKACQKRDLFDGLSRTYEKTDDAGQDFPDERKKVQLSVQSVEKRVHDALSEFIDIALTKDRANTTAKAPLVVDGNILVDNVPVTSLLTLEKQLVDLRTLVGNIPILDDAQPWTKDESTGLFKTDNPVKTEKTKLTNVPVVLYQATDKHPAQVQMAQEHQIIGYYNTTKHSGAARAVDKQATLDRIEKLIRAVKIAREAANMVEAERKIGDGQKIMDYVFGSKATA